MGEKGEETKTMIRPPAKKKKPMIRVRPVADRSIGFWVPRPPVSDVGLFGL